MAQEQPEDEWIGAAAARTMTGLSQRQLGRLAESGAIATEQGTDGRRRYFVKDCRAHNSDEGGQSDLLRACTGMLEVANKQINSLMVNMNKPLDLLLTGLKDENEGMRERIRYLESIHLEVFKFRDQLQTDQTVRDIALSEHTAKQARQTELMGLVKEKLWPKIVAGVGNNRAVGDFFASLTDNQLAALDESNFFTPEQFEKLSNLMPARTKPNGASNGAEGPKDDTTN